MFTVYKITNTINGKFYIGFTSENPPEKRWKGHQASAKHGSCTHFHCSIRKYGTSSFLFETIEQVENRDYGLKIREPHWISTLKPEYNESAGGEGPNGHKHSDSHRRKNSEAKMGNQNSLGCHFKRTEADTRANSDRQRGIPHGPQIRITCPHCQKIGGSGNMRRYHFDKCGKRGFYGI
jgi:group I intron endonuclease